MSAFTAIAGTRRAALLTLGSAALAQASPAWAKKKLWRIAEIKHVSHAALDADERGFVAGLLSTGLKEGEDFVIVRFDGQGDLQQVREMANQISAQPFDLVHSIATTPSQAVLRTGNKRPLVFSSVTDPVHAQLVPVNGASGSKSGTNVTGVSDLWPVEMQLRTYARIVPTARVWGTIYNPAESNAIVHLSRMHAVAQRLGLTLLEAKVRNMAEVPVAADNLLQRVQALTITSDNTTVARMAELAQLCGARRIPLFAGDVESVERGAVAAYGLDYYLVGYAAGRKAALVMKGVPVGAIAWGPVEKFSLTLNLQAAQAQGVVFEPDILAKADKIIPLSNTPEAGTAL